MQINPIPNDIHIGDNTHHHDHDITLVNFNTINAIVSTPINPIPPLAVAVT